MIFLLPSKTFIISIRLGEYTILVSIIVIRYRFFNSHIPGKAFFLYIRVMTADKNTRQCIIRYFNLVCTSDFL